MSTATDRRPMAEAFRGWPTMARFVLRRNWLRLSVWTVALVTMIPLVFESQRAAFPTAADRAAYAAIANTPTVAALTGLPYAADTLGGILVIKIWMTIAIALAFAAIFLVTRNGRAEEEEGRTELVRSSVLGLHAYTLASYLVIGGFVVLVGVLIALVATAVGLPAAGSLPLGASFAGVGLFFLGVAALAGQLTSTGRSANAAGAVAIAVAFIIRAVGDLNSSGDQASWISWFSPIGWAQHMRPFGENLWWPLVLLVGGGVVLCVGAMALESRRDLGAGMVPDRPGPDRGGRIVTNPFGLAVRLERASLIGWIAAVVAMAVLYGSVATAMADLISPDNPIYAVLGIDSAAVIDGMLGLLVMMVALVVTAFAVQSAIQLRAEESSGRGEVQLTGGISRTRWAVQRLAVSVIGSALMLALGGLTMGIAYGATQADAPPAWHLAGAAIAYWPGIMLTLGVVVLLIGFLPRVSIAASWAFFAVMAIVSIFGDLFRLPSWVIEHTPITATPRLLEESATGGALIVLSAIAVGLWALGLLRFARRDYQAGA
jgi:polyether ionophore transport system permease protein